ncbi:MAG: flagellar export protein FliJ [Chloroflexota bacterium]
MEEGKFRLQPVLSYKERLEEVLQLELSQLDRAYLKEQEVLDRMMEEKHSHMESLRVQWQEAKPEMHLLELGLRFLHHLAKNIEEQTTLVDSIKSQLQRKRVELIEVSHAKRTLEKLKERQRVQWTRQREKKDAKRSDELAALRHYKTQSSVQ